MPFDRHRSRPTVTADRVPASGDGFITLPDGTRRWGRFGAAGVLVRCAAGDGTFDYFLARRSEYCHQGGTWAVPGGALNEREDPLAGALREFAEEVGVDLADFAVVTIHEDDHGGWCYWTVIVDVPARFAAAVTNWETAETAWIAGHLLADLELLPPFRATLTRLGLL
ncbi:MAG TPA: NUDIX hydrolase [Acidimicrobiia bacterium]|nr:NUDIX hydrolase [Acidimicrobiia bacterium]